MESSESPETARILEDVNTAVACARKYGATYRYWDVWLLITTIMFAALATCLAGGMSILGQRALEQTFGTWTFLCFAIFILTASGTIAGMTHKALRVSDRVADAERCLARLGALKLLIDSNLIEPAAAAETYTQITAEHSSPLRQAPQSSPTQPPFDFRPSR